jgi:hypothetical protein
MSRIAMTVVQWVRPAHDGHPAQQTKCHVVSIGDSIKTKCGYDIPPDARVVAITLDWHVHATCYNCVYQLWENHAPAGYIRPASGSDFPLRRVDQPSPAARTAAPVASAPVLRRAPRDPGNPAPSRIRRWHIDNPYDHESCASCGESLTRGNLINIEYEAGVMHAACSDAPYQPGKPAVGGT